MTFQITQGHPVGWLKTKDMASELGIHPRTLVHRWQFLKEGAHWKQGPHHNSTKWWCRETVFAAAREQGYVIPADLAPTESAD